MIFKPPFSDFLFQVFFFYMDKRTYNNIDNSKLKKVKKNPVQELFSTLPQLAISSAFLLFAWYTHESPFSTQR